jgi:hypothetical protein
VLESCRLLVLATLAALGLWWGRASDRRRAVGLLAAYYVGVHCLMAVEARYLDPAWPLAAGLGAAAITDWLGGGRAHRPSMASVWLTVVPVGALVALCLVLVTAYPGRTAVGAVAFDRALARQPREAWLWRQKGFFELGQGRAKEAVSDLRAAAVLDPEEAPAFQLEWAAWAAGEPPLDIALVQADASRPRVGLLHSLQALERGEAERAVAEFQRARAAWQASGCFSRDESGRTLLAKMCPSDTRLCDVDLRSLLEIVGETRRGALARAAAEADPGLAACVDVAADHLAAVKLRNPPMGRPDLP